MSSVEKIKELFTKSKITVGSRIDDRIFRDALTAFEGSEDEKSISAGSNLRRITMKVRITKFAAGAAIAIAVLVGIHRFGGSPDGSGVAWADVAKNMETINSFTCRMTTWEKPAQKLNDTESTQTKETAMQFWYSDELGFKMEQHSDGDLSLIVCMLYQSNEGMRIWPQEKKYVRQQLSDEERSMMNPQEMDPRQWVRRFMAADYKPLGKDVIDGVTVEGVEINELGVIRKWSGQTPIKDYAARLWVDVESLRPVRIEEEGTLGTIRYGGGADQFEWNAPLTAADIEPDIPGDHTLVQ
jgi:hypothetical protein